MRDFRLKGNASLNYVQKEKERRSTTVMQDSYRRLTAGCEAFFAFRSRVKGQESDYPVLRLSSDTRTSVEDEVHDTASCVLFVGSSSLNLRVTHTQFAGRSYACKPLRTEAVTEEVLSKIHKNEQLCPGRRVLLHRFYQRHDVHFHGSLFLTYGRFKYSRSWNFHLFVGDGERTDGSGDRSDSGILCCESTDVLPRHRTPGLTSLCPEEHPLLPLPQCPPQPRLVPRLGLSLF